MSIPDLNKVIKLQDERPGSPSTKQEKSDNASDVDMVEKETVILGPVTVTKSIVVIDSNIDNSEDVPPDPTVWTQFGPTYRPLPTPEYPQFPEGFVHPKPKTVQGYPSSYPTGGGGYPTKGGQSHSYPESGGQVFGVGKRKPPPDSAPPDSAPARRGGDEDEEAEEEEEEEEVPSWVYTPATKNGWLFQVFIILFFMNLITTIAVIILEAVLGDYFVKSALGFGGSIVCLSLLVLMVAFQFRMCCIGTPSAGLVMVLSVPLMTFLFTTATCFGDTIIFILMLITRTVVSFFLYLLAGMGTNFNSWCMYCLVPILSTAILGCFYGITIFLLDIIPESYELIGPFFIFFENCVFVFVLQYVLKGSYEEQGDDIYAYLATSLYLAPFYLFLVVLILWGLCSAAQRRRRRW